MTSTHQNKIARTSSSTEDIISSLPGALISHILSFLPTKLAVATSVLSKRWTPLWKSVLTLHFDCESFKDFESFRQFAHSLLVMRDATLPIREIRCDNISNKVDPCDLNRFVQAAAQRGLEICDLQMGHIYETVPVPCLLRILSCKTLVVLKLAYLEVHQVPNLVDLPLLKTLHLDGIHFTCSFVHFMNLLRGCPVLVEFFLNAIQVPDIPNDFVEVEEFKGFSKLVRAYLVRDDLGFEESFLFPSLYNVKFLHVELSSNSFYPVLPTFHNLTHMELQLCFYSSWLMKWELVMQVLQHCPILQNLTIDEDYRNINPTGDKDWTEPETIPECLSSQLRKCSLRGFRGTKFELHFAEYILLNSKLLCTMTVKTDNRNRLDGDAKLQMLKKLSSYPRGSVTCKLLFD